MSKENRDRDLFLKAKITLVMHHPFFASLLFHLRTVELSPAQCVANNIFTAAVDGKCIYYCREFVEKCTERERLGLLIHEVLHPALGHLWRRGHRDVNRWGKAIDYVVNLEIMGVKDKEGRQVCDLPAEPLLDKKYAGMSSEQVYASLEEDDQKNEKRGRDPKSYQFDLHLEKPMADPGDGKDDEKKDEKKDSKAKAQGKPQPKPEEAEDEGQGDDQDEQEQDEQEESSGGGGGCEDESPDQMDKEWQMRVVSAAINAKLQGKMPLGWERVLGDITEPKVPWDEYVCQLLTESSRDDYDLNRVDRRFSQIGFYFPELHSEQTDVVFVVDASGSMGEDELNASIAEIAGLVRSRNVKAIRLIVHDAEVHLDTMIQSFDEIPHALPGGGGTDFRPVFDLLEEEGAKPALLIHLTDTIGTWPDYEPQYPVLTLITKRAGYEETGHHNDPPFGTAVIYPIGKGAGAIQKV